MAIFVLPSVLDTRAASELRDAICGHRGSALILDARDVGFLGGLCLEAILAAAHEWRAAGHGFAIANASEAFCACWRDLAAPADLFQAELIEDDAA